MSGDQQDQSQQDEDARDQGCSSQHALARLRSAADAHRMTLALELQPRQLGTTRRKVTSSGRRVNRLEPIGRREPLSRPVGGLHQRDELGRLEVLGQPHDAAEPFLELG